jgi:glycosyltransferase involved in cell wall biosynthesis
VAGRILFISAWFPTPPTNGARLRTYKMLSALHAAGHSCHLFSLERPAGHLNEKVPWTSTVTMPREQPTRSEKVVAWFSLLPRHFRLSFSPLVLDQIQKLVDTESFDAVVAYEFGAAHYAYHLHAPRLVKVIDGCEPFMFVSPSWNPRVLLRLWKFRRFLRRMLEGFDAYITVSPQELDWIRREVAPQTAFGLHVPNGTDLGVVNPRRLDPLRVVYTGSVRYRANRDAVEYLAQHVWPGLLKRLPDARLVVTGELPEPSEAGGLASLPQVTLAGLIDDYRDFVASSGALAVPLRFGGGTRIKVLDALALGCPVVASPKAIEGLDLHEGVEVMIARSAAEFTNSLVSVLTDQPLRVRLVRNGRQAARRYDWATAQQKFVQAVEAALSRRQMSPTA